jgi:hypothetical protein
MPSLARFERVIHQMAQWIKFIGRAEDVAYNMLLIPIKVMCRTEYVNFVPRR